MRVVVTGGAGYAGSILVRGLLRDGHDVGVLDSLLYGGDSLRGLSSHDRFELVRGDVRDRAGVRRALVGADAVVHLAAIVGDAACARRPELARTVNLDGSILVHEESRRAGVELLVFASTCSNYGRVGNGVPIAEDAELRPTSLYAETKVAAEEELLRARDGSAVTVLRLATLFGVSPRMRFDLTVNELVLASLTKGELDVYGERSWRPYLHVADAGRAIRLILAQPRNRIDGRVFNVGATEENYTKARLVSLVCEEVGREVRVRSVAAPDDLRDYRVSFERIRSELGFRVTRSVRDGIRELVEAIGSGAAGDPSHPRCRN